MLYDLKGIIKKLIRNEDSKILVAWAIRCSSMLYTSPCRSLFPKERVALDRFLVFHGYHLHNGFELENTFL